MERGWVRKRENHAERKSGGKGFDANGERARSGGGGRREERGEKGTVKQEEKQEEVGWKKKQKIDGHRVSSTGYTGYTNDKDESNFTITDAPSRPGRRCKSTPEFLIIDKNVRTHARTHACTHGRTGERETEREKGRRMREEGEKESRSKTRRRGQPQRLGLLSLPFPFASRRSRSVSPFGLLASLSLSFAPSHAQPFMFR